MKCARIINQVILAKINEPKIRLKRGPDNYLEEVGEIEYYHMSLITI